MIAKVKNRPFYLGASAKRWAMTSSQWPLDNGFWLWMSTHQWDVDQAKASWDILLNHMSLDISSEGNCRCAQIEANGPALYLCQTEGCSSNTFLIGIPHINYSGISWAFVCVCVCAYMFYRSRTEFLRFLIFTCQTKHTLVFPCFDHTLENIRENTCWGLES